MWLGTVFYRLVGQGDHPKSSLEALNGVLFAGKFGLQGGHILLEQGNLIIGGLELPLSKEEVGPQLGSNLVCGLEDIDDFSPIGGKTIGVRGERA